MTERKAGLSMRARDVMTTNVVTVTTGTTVNAAATLLVSHGFTALIYGGHGRWTVDVLAEAVRGVTVVHIAREGAPR